MREQISVRTRFERFPATVKGAFIVRGEDANPHLVIFKGASVTRIGDGTGQPVPMKVDLLNIVPHQDMFLPFEFPTTDFEPGWYTLALELEVDGILQTFDDGRRFTSAWPRGSVRRGAIAAGDVMEVGDARVTIAGIDGNTDTTSIRLSVEPTDVGDQLSVSLFADGEPLPVIELSQESGSVMVLAFPLLRAYRELVVTANLGSVQSEPATIKLPG